NFNKGATMTHSRAFKEQVVRRGLAAAGGALLGLACLVGCGGTGMEAGAPDLSMPAPDLAPGDDGGSGAVAPIIVSVSPTGHDRFYGVAYDPQGNIYATGQVASSTDSKADYATVVAKLT